MCAEFAAVAVAQGLAAGTSGCVWRRWRASVVCPRRGAHDARAAQRVRTGGSQGPVWLCSHENSMRVGGWVRYSPFKTRAAPDDENAIEAKVLDFYRDKWTDARPSTSGSVWTVGMAASLASYVSTCATSSGLRNWAEAPNKVRLVVCGM